MNKHIVTQSELRARAKGGTAASLQTSETVLPSASKEAGGRQTTMSRTQIPKKDGKPVYVDAKSGREFSEKPEEMTHLSGNQLVPKTHPRICFRGKLDSLMACVLEAQALSKEKGDEQLVAHLQEVLDYARAILGAEVKEEVLPEIRMEGMDTAALRHASHDIKSSVGIEHPIPDHKMGTLAMSLNHLRTAIRETELAAAVAFEDAHGNCGRKDIVEGLNRLSSYVYILFCREAAKGDGNVAGSSAPIARTIPVEVSARHVHLNKEALATLFGPGYELHNVRELSQPGQYLTEEKVKLIGPKGEFPKVSILGPVRGALQVELSANDCRTLGVTAPVNLSGDLTGAGDVTIVGPQGQIEAKGAVIIAKEHLHMQASEAASYGVTDGEHVRVRLHTERPVTLDDVLVRVHENFRPAVHIDTDQANAGSVSGEVFGTILKQD